LSLSWNHGESRKHGKGEQRLKGEGVRWRRGRDDEGVEVGYGERVSFSPTD